MTRAQDALLRRIHAAGIAMEDDVRREFYRRVERGCLDAQLKQPMWPMGRGGTMNGQGTNAVTSASCEASKPVQTGEEAP